MENLVNIGTIVGTHHLRGSVKITSIFENIELIENDKKAILDFEGIENIDAAKELNGYKVKIRRDLLPERNEDDFYVKDLFGIEVFSENEKIGEIIDVMETAAHNILIIEDINTKKEIMVPLIDEFVTKIDFPNNRIEVSLIDGMRE